MKRIYIILFSVLLVLIASIFIVSILFSLPDITTLSDTKAKGIQYHYVMIGQGTDETFNEQIKNGAAQAANDLGAVVEVNNVRPSDTFTVERYFDMALDSKVDGIAVQVIDSNAIQPYLKKAEALKIPVVTFETDSQLNVPTIGTNSLRVGNEAGKLALKCKKDGKAEIAVILNSFSNSEKQPAENLKIAGMAEILNGTPGMHLRSEAVKKTDGGVFSAEKVTSEILREFPDINLIVATNEMDTLGVIDVIVDAYKVGRVDVIGYGSLPEIVQYIKRNVIFGTVVADPYKIGYGSIKALVDISKTGNTTFYQETGVSAYTKENADELVTAK
jgi:ribose transport system substrate-binding protein